MGVCLTDKDNSVTKLNNSVTKRDRLFSSLFLSLMAIVIVCLIALQFHYPFHINDCSSDGAEFTKTGIVVDVMFLGDCNMITFNDSSVLYLHGSPNEKYDLYEIKSLLSKGTNYSFSYHHECVMSDGNEIYYHEGNVIDRIKVNNPNV